MTTIEIKKNSITDVGTDAIVNAANEGLQAGGGVCGAIFKAAGYAPLQEACDKIGHCPTGEAVITPAFHLNAKYIIHAVGPRWSGGNNGERKYLRRAFYNSLNLARDNGCHSIGFPLISTGIFGYPVDLAWKEALSVCLYFKMKNPDADMRIVFAIRDDDVLQKGQQLLQKVSSGKEEQKEEIPDDSGKSDTLKIGWRSFPAVYFHKPEEPYGFLSNWYPARFRLDDRWFSSTEQYLMYQKAELFGDHVTAEAILRTDDPAEQKALGREVIGYNSNVWAGCRQLIMLRGLEAKFSQNEDLKKQLLDTGSSFLVECAGGDKVWACGVRLDDEAHCDSANWSGTNLLGFALMEVRTRLSEG